MSPCPGAAHPRPLGLSESTGKLERCNDSFRKISARLPEILLPGYPAPTMHRALKRKARELTERLAQIDHGQRGMAQASRDALKRHRCPGAVARAAGRQCEAIANSTGERCKVQCVGKANRCCHHGGHELDPTCSATVRWHRRTGRMVEAIRRQKKALGQIIKTMTDEERMTVGQYVSPRAAGGRVTRDQALVLGVFALRAFRDDTDPLAWSKWVKNAKRMRVHNLPSPEIAAERQARREREEG